MYVLVVVIIHMGSPGLQLWLNAGGFHPAEAM